MKVETKNVRDVEELMEKVAGKDVNGKYVRYNDLKNDKVVIIYKNYAKKSSVLTAYVKYIEEGFEPIIKVYPEDVNKVVRNIKKINENTTVIIPDSSAADREKFSIIFTKYWNEKINHNIKKLKGFIKENEDKIILADELIPYAKNEAVPLSKITSAIKAIPGFLQNISKLDVAKEYEELVIDFVAKVIINSMKIAEKVDLENIKNVIEDINNSIMINTLFENAPYYEAAVISLPYLTESLHEVFLKINEDKLNERLKKSGELDDYIIESVNYPFVTIKLTKEQYAFMLAKNIIIKGYIKVN